MHKVKMLMIMKFYVQLVKMVINYIRIYVLNIVQIFVQNVYLKMINIIVLNVKMIKKEENNLLIIMNVQNVQKIVHYVDQEHKMKLNISIPYSIILNIQNTLINAF